MRMVFDDFASFWCGTPLPRGGEGKSWGFRHIGPPSTLFTHKARIGEFFLKGRTPAPTTQKKVTGTLRASRENKREPQLAVASYQSAPASMTAEGKAVWKIFCPLAASMGVLTEADLQTLERLCEVAAEVRRLTKVISEEGHTYSTDAGLIKAHPAVAMAADADRRLLSYLTHFGMTPAARSKVQAIGEPPSKDPEDEFFN